jgi:hypothetical protein
MNHELISCPAAPHIQGPMVGQRGDRIWELGWRKLKLLVWVQVQPEVVG